MLGILKKLFSPAAAEKRLYFKDGRCAFEFACEFLKTDLVAEAIIPALVDDAKEALGTDEAVAMMQDGTQILALRVCSTDNGFLVLAGTLSASGPRLKPGDLVAWRAGKPIECESLALQSDPRSKWVGIVLAKLKPQYQPGRGWAIEEPFLP
jgi:membrane-bound inhibitor of C-type lysozyme